MRRLFYLPVVVLIIAFLTSCNNEKSNDFTVDIQLSGQPDSWIIAQIRQDGDWVKLDSSELKDGFVSFKGNLDMPQLYYFSLKDSRNYMPIFLESGKINVRADVENIREATVEGSGSHATYKELENELKAN